MSSGANVQAIQALDDLKGGLNRFAGEAQEVLQAAEQALRQTEEWLQERLNHWQNEVQRRQEEVRRAEAALAHCRASGYRDRDGHYHAPDCSACEQAVFQARARLREAEAELRNVQEWLRMVGEAATAYRLQARRLGWQLAMDLPRADAFLERKIAELQAYLAVSAPAGAGATVFADSAAAVGIRQWNVAGSSAESERLRDALGRLEGSSEGIHVQWGRADSIDQEYHAFRAQAEVWNELKGNEVDEQCDWVSGMIAQGEAGAKAIIRFLYPDLPEIA